jgi:hypothetical protein
MDVNDFSQDSITEITVALDNLFLEEEVDVLEVAASFATLSTFGTATGCASTLGTVSCIG